MSGRVRIDWALVERLYQPGDSIGRLLGKCRREGVGASHSAIAGWLRTHRAAPTQSTESEIANRVGRALESDDLGELDRAAAVVREAMRAWEPELTAKPPNRFAVQAYAGLTSLLAAIAKARSDLMPRVDVERSRLEALGETARASLLARVEGTAKADERLRIINLRQRSRIAELEGRGHA